MEYEVILISVERVQSTAIRNSLQKMPDPLGVDLLILDVGDVYGCDAFGAEEVGADDAEQLGCGVAAVPFLAEEPAGDVVFLLPLFEAADELLPVVAVCGGELRLEGATIGPDPLEQYFAYIFGHVLGRYLLLLLLMGGFFSFGLLGWFVIL